LEQNIIKMALLLCIFPNPEKVSDSGGIFAGAGFLPDLEKNAGFRPEPESGTALNTGHDTTNTVTQYYCSNTLTRRIQ